MNTKHKARQDLTTAKAMNNFDLIRLAAAIQVFVGHAFLFGFLQHNLVRDIIWFFPGVPVFFGMSGFLLLWSLDRNPDLVSYCKNRFLRLFPALWATMLLTTAVLLIAKTISFDDLLGSPALLYLIGRCTIIYSFVPQLIRRFAQGNPNGALWTIGVELQFYLLLPLLHRAIRRQPLLMKNIILLTIGAISYWINRSDPNLPFDVYRLNGYLRILISEIRIFYFLFFFIIGMLFYINYSWLKKLLEGRCGIHFVIYCIICAAFFFCTDLSKADPYFPDAIALIRYVFLMFFIFSTAFSNVELSWRLLRGNDYSYGIYLTHLLVLNAFYESHRFTGRMSFVLSAVVTGILAWASWHFIEKKALRLKKYSLRSLVNRKDKMAPAGF